MSDEVLYRRIQHGRRVRYEPVGRRWDRNVWPIGYHIVHIPEDGGRVIMCGVDPDHAGLLVAMREHRDVAVDAARQALIGRPAQRLGEETARRAYEAYRRAGGEDWMQWVVESPQGVVDVITNAVAERVKEGRDGR